MAPAFRRVAEERLGFGRSAVLVDRLPEVRAEPAPQLAGVGICVVDGLEGRRGLAEERDPLGGVQLVSGQVEERLGQLRPLNRRAFQPLGLLDSQ